MPSLHAFDLRHNVGAVGRRKRAKERRALLDRVAESYSAHRGSWTPTADVARDLCISEEAAAGLVARAREFGIPDSPRAPANRGDSERSTDDDRS